MVLKGMGKPGTLGKIGEPLGKSENRWENQKTLGNIKEPGEKSRRTEASQHQHQTIN